MFRTFAAAVIAAALLTPLLPAAASPAPAGVLLDWHEEAGWHSYRIATDGGDLDFRLVLHDVASTRWGIGIALYDAADRPLGTLQYLVDEHDGYSPTGAFRMSGSWIDGHMEQRFDLRCDGCPSAAKVVYWFAGEAAAWEARVVGAGTVSVVAQDAGDDVVLLHTEEFGASEAPAGLAYAAVDERLEVVAHNSLVGGFAASSSFWDDDAYGATYRDLRVSGPAGGGIACPGSCALLELHGSGTYAFDVRAAGAGLTTQPVFFVGADVRLPS